MSSNSNDKLDEMIFHLKNIFECLVDSFFERNKENILKIFKNEFRIDGNLGKPFVDLFEFNYSWIENGAFTRTGVRYDSNV